MLLAIQQSICVSSRVRDLDFQQLVCGLLTFNWLPMLLNIHYVWFKHKWKLKGCIFQFPHKELMRFLFLVVMKIIYHLTKILI